MDIAEEVTGYRPGNPTWPFAGMLSLADAGARVRYIEDVDYRSFCADPHAALLEQFGDPAIVESILAVTDLALESKRIERLYSHPNFAFDRRIPSLDEVIAEANAGGAVICNVNSRVLKGEQGYTGHFVVVTEMRDGQLVLQNPGQPPSRDQLVSPSTFRKAWAEPSPRLANAIVIS